MGSVTISRNILSNISEMNLWVSSAANVHITENTVIGPYQYRPVATCCPPYPYPQPATPVESGQSFVAWATKSNDIFVKDNCVRKMEGCVAGNLILFNATDSVQNSAIANGG